MIDLNPYLSWMVASTAPELVSSLGEAELRRGLEEELRFDVLERMGEAEMARRYQELCPVSGAEPGDYMPREVEVFPGKFLLTGIHFRGLETDFPFVGVYAQQEAFGAEELLEASRRLCGILACFRPDWVRWWSPQRSIGPLAPASAMDLIAPSAASELQKPEPGLKPSMLARSDLRTLPGAQGDQRVLAGELESLLCRPLPPNSHRCELKRDGTGHTFETYTRIFDRFILENHEWAGRIARTDREDYLDCARAGGLFWLEVDGQVAGIIAARPGVIRGLRGWEMLDEILAGEFRGRGLGSVMQRLFLERLDRAKAGLVIGTIDYDNHPSIRTALRVGRRDVGGWVFVKGDGPEPANL